ncbi:uncharacterized protein N7498_007690 [Penicillium cinerascens]|uniref:Alpha-galactosidase n=1 Tax=Penicillium cinerascens TaxID=70096 RepID=A0A9W9JKH3_9EURO|nr:uncharacterized protein N7498_007690 [Penicillium cinerascens]KAJ5198573.1 hypothetical protein N7498_007690 [Penicillium cinerascens]
MGWNTYNYYSCSPNESIVHSNAKALVDLGLADLGYRYVTTDCGWTVADRLPDGSLTWNETLFPSGFPALGEYIHDLGLLFGVYEDAGIRTCQVNIEQAGSLYHEEHDATTFAEWNIDALKYDNCFSNAAAGYPDADYTPSTSPRFRYANMTNALGQHRAVLFQICEWGVDFPARWAPSLGQTWRIGNDIIPAWRAIFRTLNQAVPNTAFAGPSQWPDLDMLEIGTNALTTVEEQTHFSMWAILKSPLTIGGALKDEFTSISEASLGVLRNKDVIGFNQDALGVSANLRRRWSEEGYEVWSGPLENGRMVAALINWDDEDRKLTLDLPVVGVQFAGMVKDVWAGKVAENVRTGYTSTVSAHGVMLLELSSTIQAGVYSADLFATKNGVPDEVWRRVLQARWLEDRLLERKQPPTIAIPASVPCLDASNAKSKYLEIDYINNDIAFSTSWGWGSNSRNLTISLNDREPVRLEVPLSGRHSELFGPGLGWWDTATLGLLVGGWKNGNNVVVLGNYDSTDVSQTYAPDIVGVRVFD